MLISVDGMNMGIGELPIYRESQKKEKKLLGIFRKDCMIFTKTFFEF